MDPTVEALEPLLHVHDLRQSFDGVSVLDDVNLQVHRGETLVVLGPSGAGKSVLLKCIVGLLRPDAGEVFFRRRRIDTIPERRLGPIRREIGFLFQLSGLFDSMSVLQNVAFPLREHLTLTESQCKDRVAATLRLVGMEDFMHQYPADLSGGQQRRVALARAIVLEPSMLLYDEPTAGLDPIRSDLVSRIVRRLQNELTLTSIVVTHDIALATKVADRIMLLEEGRVHCVGPRDDILGSKDPIVRRFLEGISEPDMLEHS